MRGTFIIFKGLKFGKGLTCYERNFHNLLSSGFNRREGGQTGREEEKGTEGNVTVEMEVKTGVAMVAIVAVG